MLFSAKSMDFERVNASFIIKGRYACMRSSATCDGKGDKSYGITEHLELLQKADKECASSSDRPKSYIKKYSKGNFAAIFWDKRIADAACPLLTYVTIEKFAFVPLYIGALNPSKDRYFESTLSFFSCVARKFS